VLNCKKTTGQANRLFLKNRGLFSNRRGAARTPLLHAGYEALQVSGKPVHEMFGGAFI
jgi:hypothetical protein